jgi:hypothetical protein
VLACEVIRDELEKVLRELGGGFDVSWVDSELHNTPALLRSFLQEKLDALSGACSGNSGGTVLLTFGKCGGAVTGLRTGAWTLVMPRVDDCISLLLGSQSRRAEMKSGMYFLTAGWLRGKRNIYAEYEYAIKKYGEELTKQIFDELFGNYKFISILDTGSFDLSAVTEETMKIARAFSLDHCVVDGTTQYLRDLLTGNWDDERFVIVPPNSVVPDV